METFSNRFLNDAWKKLSDDKRKELNNAMLKLANDKDWKYVYENYFMPILKALDSLHSDSDIFEQPDLSPQSALIELKSQIKAFNILDSVCSKINCMATKKVTDIDDWSPLEHMQ